MKAFTISVCLSLGSIALGCSDDEDDDRTTEESTAERRPDASVPRDAGASDMDGGGALDASGRDASLDAGTPATLPRTSDGGWVAFAPDGAIVPAPSLSGLATARAVDGGMQVVLNVAGLPPSRGFGAHLHRLRCAEMSAGGHYQHAPGGATDPAFANPENEVWLDFTTSAAGEGMQQATVDWVPRAGQASAVVIHERLTGDGGVAGAKLYCTEIPL